MLNVFRMFGMMGAERVQARSSGALEADAIIGNGVRERPDIGALASREDRGVTVLIWNYHDDDVPAPPAEIALSIAGAAPRALVTHYRIDAGHSNSYEAWKKMGSPQGPTPAEYGELERAGQLPLLGSPEWRSAVDGKVGVRFTLPRQGVSLLTLSW